MELVFELLNTKQFVPAQGCQKTFTQAGGVIGRGEDCEWIIADGTRHLSSHHALISYREGAFFLTDTSSNGVLERASGARNASTDAVNGSTPSSSTNSSRYVHSRTSTRWPNAASISCTNSTVSSMRRR